jgi:DMSO/TMAO reductase YedYZ heme-binding membrane subunit
LPKCPLCWAAYASVAAGLGVAPAAGHNLILGALAAALIAALAALAMRSRVIADRRPLLPAGLGAAAVLLGRLALGSMALVYLGLAVLAGAAVWSAWPRRCPRAS